MDDATVDHLQAATPGVLAIDFEPPAQAPMPSAAGQLEHLDDTQVRALLETVLAEGVARGFGLTWWALM